MASELEATLMDIWQQTYDRVIELIMAPLENMSMLWTAIPLLIATVFITLYFGRYKKEELGWNTAFGNTMVFLFMAISIIREMYNQGGGTIESIFSSNLYTLLALGLVGVGFVMMFVTYFHLLPKRLAFFLFSAPPVNTAVYVIMAIVYADVPTGYITVLAGIVFVIVILILTKIIQILLRLIGLEYITIDEIGVPKGFARTLGFEEQKKPRKKLLDD